jgi:hypothetical protein
MKMRLKPLRGQTYKTEGGNEVVFICKTSDGYSVLFKDIYVHVSDLVLPIIDTKDYEKIPEKKYKGD